MAAVAVVVAQTQTAQAAAPVDLTGYWVALVTEDWRWRMVTPKKGDFPSIPLNRAGRDLGHRVGSRERRSQRRPMQILWRRQCHAAARAIPHHVGRSEHTEG